MPKVTTVATVKGYQLELTFDDGVKGHVDLSHLAGKGVFALWQERGGFEQVRIGPSGELCWGERIDLCPDSLYLRVTGKTAEDLFPSLRLEPTRA